jgi:hypothetical protein
MELTLERALIFTTSFFSFFSIWEFIVICNKEKQINKLLDYVVQKDFQDEYFCDTVTEEGKENMGRMSELAMELEEMSEPSCPEDCECFEEEKVTVKKQKAKKGKKK